MADRTYVQSCILVQWYRRTRCRSDHGPRRQVRIRSCSATERCNMPQRRDSGREKAEVLVAVDEGPLVWEPREQGVMDESWAVVLFAGLFAWFITAVSSLRTVMRQHVLPHNLAALSVTPRAENAERCAQDDYDKEGATSGRSPDRSATDHAPVHGYRRLGLGLGRALC